MPLIKLSKLERRRLSLFFFCLILAIGAWMFFALSNRYVYEASTLVKYSNFPQNKAFHPLQSDTVKLQVEGTGWQLLFAKLRINPQSVTMNLRDLNKRNYVSFSDQLSLINQQFASDQKVISVQPDTLYFDFSARSVKKVPVRVVKDILFKNQYDVSDKIQLIPEYVTVSGPFDDLVQIDVWETEKLRLKDISGTISANIPLKKPEGANINIYPSVIDVKIPVDEFTEMSMDIPVKVRNNKSYRDIKLLPDKVKVTYMVALSNVTKIERASFEASANLADWTQKNYNQLPVTLGKFPEYCKIIKIEPQAIDFLILK
ncbi:YbbR-like domain-containing protein [Flavihumibacter sp. R14]|nr:YbbR-like domain-containing protein [Flavihumibacter soli]